MLQTTEHQPPTLPPQPIGGQPCAVCATEMLPDTKLTETDAPNNIAVGASIWRCPNTACSVTAVERADSSETAIADASAPEAAATAPAASTSSPEPAQKSMRCERCSGQILIRPLPSGHGFKVVAIEHLAPGFKLDATFGVSANGFPLCPTDGVALIPVGSTSAAEAIAAVADAVQTPPKQRRIPGIDPPFDHAQAFDSIAKKMHDVSAARREYEHRAAQAKEAKKILDSLSEQLELLISQLEERKKDAESSARGALRPSQNSPCVTERQTGMPCVICAEARKKHAAATEGIDPAKVVDQEFVSLREHLARKNVALDLDEIVACAKRPDDSLAALMKIAEADKPVDGAKWAKLPAVLQRSHLALDVVDGVQKCARCHLALVDAADIDRGEAYYAGGTIAGMDCEGTAPAEGDAEKPEPARKPQRRHKNPADAAAAKTKATRAERQAKGGKA